MEFSMTNDKCNMEDDPSARLSGFTSQFFTIIATTIGQQIIIQVEPETSARVTERAVQSEFAAAISLPLKEREPGGASHNEGAEYRDARPVEGTNQRPDRLGICSGRQRIRRTVFERNIGELFPRPVNLLLILDLADDILRRRHVFD